MTPGLNSATMAVMKVDADTTVMVLNEALAADPDAINRLFAHREWCNAALADHPSIQVVSRESRWGTLTDLGVLGLINGIVTASTGERVAARVDEATGKILGFQRYDPVAPTALEQRVAEVEKLIGKDTID